MESEKVSPQLENGYTKISNELLEALGRTYLSDYENRVIRCVVRFTYGWQRKYHKISMCQFMTFTAMRTTHICRTLKKLKDRNIITYLGNGKEKSYYIIKHYDKWKKLPNQVILPKQVIPMTQTGNNSLPKQVTPINNNKEILKKVKEITPISPLQVDSEEIFTYWNNKPELPKIGAMSQKRKTTFKMRMKDPFFKEHWKQAIDKIPTIPFLMGAGSRSWKADIDFFLRPDTCLKIIEGKYNNKVNAVKKPQLYIHQGSQDLISRKEHYEQHPEEYVIPEIENKYKDQPVVKKRSIKERNAEIEQAKIKARELLKSLGVKENV